MKPEASKTATLSTVSDEHALAIARFRLEHVAVRLQLAMRARMTFYYANLSAAQLFLVGQEFRLRRAWFGVIRVHEMRIESLHKRLSFAMRLFERFPGAYSTRRAHRRHATTEAINALYGPSGPPAGITEGLRFEQINQWLRSHGRAPVSMPTIRRALKLRRVERT